MPFISSVSSSRGGRLFNLPLPPTLVTPSITNFTESRATFGATVSANLAPTTVYFDYSTSSNFSSYTTVTYGSVTGQSSSVSSSISSGLSVGTLYYVRCRAVNSQGTTTSPSASFTTWSLKTFTQTTSGSYSVSVPSISGVAPIVYNLAVYGGGGGANYAGGGGGGYRVAASKTSSATGTQNVTGSVGAGGGGGNGGTGTGGAGSGGASTLTIGNTTYTANGGGAGAHPGTVGSPSGTGGSSGSGDNSALGGGGNTYGYYYFTGNYVQVVVGYNTYCCNFDVKTGACLQTCTDYNSPIYGNDIHQPIYAWNSSYYAGGGGGGNSGAGVAATTQTSASHVGGAGGAGYNSGYGLRGGAGGGGNGTQGQGANGAPGGTTGTIVGTGGQGWYGAGVAGGVTFQYYGP